jgi:hypothetical protein
MGVLYSRGLVDTAGLDQRASEPPVEPGLGSRERRGLADTTEVDTSQLPLLVLVDKHQCGAQLHVDGVATIVRDL